MYFGPMREAAAEFAQPMIPAVPAPERRGCFDGKRVARAFCVHPAIEGWYRKNGRTFDLSLEISGIEGVITGLGVAGYLAGTALPITTLPGLASIGVFVGATAAATAILEPCNYCLVRNVRKAIAAGREHAALNPPPAHNPQVTQEVITTQPTAAGAYVPPPVIVTMV